MRNKRAFIITIVMAMLMVLAPSSVAGATNIAYYTGEKKCSTSPATKYFQWGSSKGSSQWTQLNHPTNSYNDRYYSNTSFVYRYQTASFRHASGSIAVVKASNIDALRGSTCDN